jgi:hypothetical protein
VQLEESPTIGALGVSAMALRGIAAPKEWDVKSAFKGWFWFWFIARYCRY